jgi:hypothetical protein
VPTPQGLRCLPVEETQDQTWMVSGRAVSEEAGTLIREDGGIPRIYPWRGCQSIRANTMAPAITPVEFFAALVDWYSPEKVQMELTLSLYHHHLPPRHLPEKLVELVGLQAVRQRLAPA